MHSNMHMDGPGGFGSSSYGGPGYGDNGPGAGGVYYDWYSGYHRSTSDGSYVPWQYAYNIALQYAYETVYQGQATHDGYGGYASNPSGDVSVYAVTPVFTAFGNTATNRGVGQPGFGESLIPFWGSGRTAIDHFQHGNYLRGIGYTALAVTDVFLVKAAATAVAKGTITLAAKYALKQAVANPKYVGKEIQALANPRVAAMMQGKGIDRAFRIAADNNLILNPAERMGIVSISPMNKGADIVGKGILNGTWWDVTTSGAWGAHVAKYGPGGIGLLY